MGNPGSRGDGRSQFRAVIIRLALIRFFQSATGISVSVDLAIDVSMLVMPGTNDCSVVAAPQWCRKDLVLSTQATGIAPEVRALDIFCIYTFADHRLLHPARSIRRIPLERNIRVSDTKYLPANKTLINSLTHVQYSDYVHKPHLLSLLFANP